MRFYQNLNTFMTALHSECLLIILRFMAKQRHVFKAASK